MLVPVAWEYSLLEYNVLQTKQTTALRSAQQTDSVLCNFHRSDATPVLQPYECQLMTAIEIVQSRACLFGEP